MGDRKKRETSSHNCNKIRDTAREKLLYADLERAFKQVRNVVTKPAAINFHMFSERIVLGLEEEKEDFLSLAFLRLNLYCFSTGLIMLPLAQLPENCHMDFSSSLRSMLNGAAIVPFRNLIMCWTVSTGPQEIKQCSILPTKSLSVLCKKCAYRYRN